MADIKKALLQLIPEKKPEDQLYNRRLMSYIGLAFSILWFQEILLIIVLGFFFKIELSAATVTALLTVPATLAGLGFWKYLEACKHDDKKEKTSAEEPPTLPDSQRPADPEV